MNEHDVRLDKRLEELGDRLRSRPSIVDEGLRAIERMSPVRPARRVIRGPSLARSSLGLAACLAAGVFLWLSLAGSGGITLAEVQRSIDSKPWVLIRYGSGTQEWANLRERLCFVTHADSRNFYAGMRDHVNGIWRAYHSKWGQQIHEQRFTPRPYPQTPWEYATGDWDDRGVARLSHTTVERSADNIDGREVVRFDTYDVGPSGLRVLAQQVWADPQTRLPVRIRKYMGPDRDDKADTGDFSFPESGPSSIYDLGAPEGLPVVVNWGVIEPEAKVILDAAREALRQFPRNVCIIRKSSCVLSISYSLGDKFREETYGIVSPDHQVLFAIEEVPDDVEQPRVWAASHLTPFKVCIYDGQFSYSYDTGQGPWASPTDPGVTLNVRRDDDAWTDSRMPIWDQWPFVTNVGPMKVVKDMPDAPAGCLLLRYEGHDLQRDWYVDPARDYICVKQVEFSLNADRAEPEEPGQTMRMDLARLPSGQWYARTIVNPRILSGSAELDVRLLSDAEIEELAHENEFADFFTGEKLLKEAADRGAKVTFWAR